MRLPAQVGAPAAIEVARIGMADRPLIQINVPPQTAHTYSGQTGATRMCLGIPMEVVARDGDRARCSAQGVEREVSLLMLQDAPVAVGDFVLVYSGHATQRMTPQQARETWALLEQALAAEDGGDRI
jgi:hydrogenase expression/formation protein HypC